MASETSPLLGATSSNGQPPPSPLPPPDKSRSRSRFSPAVRLLLAGFFISVSFSFTQTPILYAFIQMQCEHYYRNNPPYSGHGDRCQLKEIDSGGTAQYAIMAMTNVFCAISNLFFTGWQMRTIGPKKALVLQNFFPIIRVSIQTIAILVGGGYGITIMQLSQLITIIGGPAGYILVLNTILADITEPAERTATFGRLQGAIMVGNAIGFLVGGFVSDRFGVDSPFELAAICLALTCLYCIIAVPPVTLTTSESEDGKDKKQGGFIAAVVNPMRALGPQRVRLSDGRVVKHYGITFLAIGIFVGVLATGYVGNLLQMYSMTAFRWDASSNSMLMCITLVVRGVFLMFIFPSIISWGRRWFTKSKRAPRHVDEDDSMSNAETVIPTEPLDLDPTHLARTVEEEPTQPLPPSPEEESGHFDLFFLRWSYLLDGLLTMCAAFISDDWQFYLVAVALPFASGSAPASKGVLTEMVPAAQKADAIQGMTLVEHFAVVSTLGLFGYIFSSLAAVGQAYLTFFCNAAIALLAIVILLFSRFPPVDSELVHDDETEETAET